MYGWHGLVVYITFIQWHMPINDVIDLINIKEKYSYCIVGLLCVYIQEGGKMILFKEFKQNHHCLHLTYSSIISVILLCGLCQHDNIPINYHATTLGQHNVHVDYNASLKPAQLVCMDMGHCQIITNWTFYT